MIMTENDKKIVRLMTLAYIAHRETDYCVFIDFSGHVEQLEIRFSESAENYLTRALEARIKTEFASLFQQRRERGEPYDGVDLEAKTNVLLQLLEDGEIDYSLVDEEIECIRSYSF